MALDILTGLLVTITAFYAWATYKILKANERVVEVMNLQMEATTRPYVTVTPFVGISSPIFRLRIKNSGKMPAKNLRLKIDKDFFIWGEKESNKNLASFPAFTNIIDSFAPQEELVFTLALGAKLFDESYDESITPKQFSVEASYSFGSTRVTEKHSIDLNPYFFADIPEDLIAKRLDEIKKVIEKLR